MEKMLLTQALDERDSLKVKIEKKIYNLDLASVKRKKDEKVKTENGKQISVEDFEAQAKASYQEVQDMIARYNRICLAIIQANASTKVKIGDEEMSVAQAITLRSQLINGKSFNGLLVKKLRGIISDTSNASAMFERTAERSRQEHLSTIMGKEKNVSDKDMSAVEAIVDGEKPDFIDPLNVANMYEDLESKYNDLANQINTALKISNATTKVEF